MFRVHRFLDQGPCVFVLGLPKRNLPGKASRYLYLKGQGTEYVGYT